MILKTDKFLSLNYSLKFTKKREWDNLREDLKYCNIEKLIIMRSLSPKRKVQYCDSNIRLFSLATCKVIKFNLLKEDLKW